MSGVNVRGSRARQCVWWDPNLLLTEAISEAVELLSCASLFICSAVLSAKRCEYSATSFALIVGITPETMRLTCDDTDI